MSAASAAKQYKLKRNDKFDKGTENPRRRLGEDGDSEAKRITAHVGTRQSMGERGSDGSQNSPYNQRVSQDLDAHDGDPPGENSTAANEPSAVSRARRVAKL